MPRIAPPHRLSRSACALALVLSAGAGPALAQSAADLEQLQATTMALIDSLVESGVLPRARADALLSSARQKAEAQLRARALAQAQAEIAAESSQARRQAESAWSRQPEELGKDGKRVVRVPYVPESVRAEMRDQIKQEVLQQARSERWGDPGAMPAWVNGLQIEGDARVRYENVRPSGSNTAPGAGGVNYYAGDLTRAADIALGAANGISNFNTQEAYSRLRLRARLGVTAAIGERVNTGVRLGTGTLPSTSRTSANQTLGSGFNNYSATVDQAWLSVRPLRDLRVTAGRFANPFFSTDLVWNEDLQFDGVAASYATEAAGGSVFATAGWFPLADDRPGTARARSLTGVQAGFEGKLAGASRFKLGMALYNFNGLDAARETTTAQLTSPLYATRYEYPAGLRQRGNTLFNVRAPGDTGTPVFGLASDFRELDITATLDLPELLPVPVRLTADYVRNLAYSREDMLARTGVAVTDGRDWGVLARVQLGKPQINRQGDWNASFTWRALGSDAVLDAFTHTDFGLGGTNNKGYIVGLNYGIHDRTALGLRVMASTPLASYLPGSASATRLSVDTVQVDLSTRF